MHRLHIHTHATCHVASCISPNIIIISVIYYVTRCPCQARQIPNNMVSSPSAASTAVKQSALNSCSHNNRTDPIISPMYKRW